MTFENANLSSAMGWSVIPYAHRWQYNAWGPAGSEKGEADTEAEAKTLGVQAYERMKRRPPLRSV